MTSSGHSSSAACPACQAEIHDFLATTALFGAAAQRNGTATAIIVEDPAEVSQVAITVEPNGDVTAATGPVVASAELPPRS